MQCPGHLPSTGVDRKQEEEEEEVKLFSPTTILEAAGEVRLTALNHLFNFNLLRQTDTESQLRLTVFSLFLKYNKKKNKKKNAAEMSQAALKEAADCACSIKPPLRTDRDVL